METQTSLLAHYTQVAILHGPTGFVGKVALLSLMLLLAQAHGKAIVQLAGLIIAVQSFSSAAIALGEGQTALVSLVGCLLGFSSLILIWKPEGAVRSLPEGGWRLGLALVLWAWAIWFPVFSHPKSVAGMFKALFGSPVGALPHPTILATLVVVFSSRPNAPRILGWAAVASGVILGVGDSVLAGIHSSLVLAAFAALVGWEMLRSASQVGVAEDDTPPVDKAATRPRRKSAAEEPEGPRRVWKIK